MLKAVREGRLQRAVIDSRLLLRLMWRWRLVRRREMRGIHWLGRRLGGGMELLGWHGVGLGTAVVRVVVRRRRCRGVGRMLLRVRMRPRRMRRDHRR